MAFPVKEVAQALQQLRGGRLDDCFLRRAYPEPGLPGAINGRLDGGEKWLEDRPVAAVGNQGHLVADDVEVAVGMGRVAVGNGGVPALDVVAGDCLLDVLVVVEDRVDGVQGLPVVIIVVVVSEDVCIAIFVYQGTWLVGRGVDSFVVPVAFEV